MPLFFAIPSQDSLMSKDATAFFYEFRSFRALFC